MNNELLQSIFEQLREAGVFANDLPLEKKREVMEASIGASSIAEDSAFEAAELGGVSGLWCRPASHNPGRVLLYNHGGGYSLGSSKAYRGLVSQIAARTGASVFCADYRLAPENRFPAAVDDMLSVYRALLEDGVAAETIAFVGDSAGGGLTLSLLLALKQENLPLPIAAVVYSPYADLTQSGASWEIKKDSDPLLGVTSDKHAMANTYLQGQDPRNPLASPLFGDLSNLPPILIQVGSNECLLDDSTQLAAKLATANGNVTLEVYSDMFHVFQGLYDALKEAGEALDSTATFLGRYWK